MENNHTFSHTGAYKRSLKLRHVLSACGSNPFVMTVNILPIIEKLVVTFYSAIRDFGDLLTFPLVPP